MGQNCPARLIRSQSFGDGQAVQSANCCKIVLLHPFAGFVDWIRRPVVRRVDV